MTPIPSYILMSRMRRAHHDQWWIHFWPYFSQKLHGNERNFTRGVSLTPPWVSRWHYRTRNSYSNLPHWIDPVVMVVVLVGQGAQASSPVSFLCVSISHGSHVSFCLVWPGRQTGIIIYRIIIILYKEDFCQCQQRASRTEFQINTIKFWYVKFFWRAKQLKLCLKRPIFEDPKTTR